MASWSHVPEAIKRLRGELRDLVPEGSKVPRLVAVSKTKPPEAILAAYADGQRDFGENYVDEIIAKAPALPGDVRWRFIGHLQSNKAKKLVQGVPGLVAVETVDSVKLADKLNAACVSLGRRAKLEVMVQVNTSGEASKSGLEPGPEVAALCAHICAACDALELTGLMTIGRIGDTTRECFDRLAAARDAVSEGMRGSRAGGTFSELSMGMSADFRTAVQCGSTSVRVGSTIFGKREYPAKPGQALAESGKAPVPAKEASQAPSRGVASADAKSWLGLDLSVGGALATAMGVSFCIKLLLTNTHHSTDLEVHRNWFALTYSLPPSEWYFDSTSQWTLDYPPLFALFQCALAPLAALFDPGMLAVQAAPYLTAEAKTFMRLSAITTDVVLALGVWLCVGAGSREKAREVAGAWSVLLLVGFNAGLLLIDHVHFQYNGLLFGVLLVSIGCFRRSRALESTAWTILGAASFAALLMLKHLFLSLAPLYFVYLLCGFCRVSGRGFSLPRFLALGATVVVVSALALAPILVDAVHRSSSPPSTTVLEQLAQIASRLFPFGPQECNTDASGHPTSNACHERGLLHAYWAANLWALYVFADRAVAFIIRRVPTAAVLLELGCLSVSGSVDAGSPTSGLVQSVVTVVLKQVTPGTTAVMTLLASLPALVSVCVGGLDQQSRQRRQRAFELAVVHCALSAFCFGWHVHEKAVLTALVPLALLAPTSQELARLYFRLSLFGIYALFPLFTQVQELPIKVLCFMVHMSLAVSMVRAKCTGDQPVLTTLDKLSMASIFGLFVFSEVYHPLVMAPRGEMPFLPLMATSVVCGCGVLTCWWSSLLMLSSTANNDGNQPESVKKAKSD